MRILVTIMIALSVVASVIAESAAVVETGKNVSAAASVTNETNLVQGELDGFYVDVAAGATNGVVITGNGQTLLNVSGVTADTFYRVRFPAVTSTGASVASSTNNRAVLDGKLTIVYSATTVATNDVKVTVVTRD